MVLYPVLLFLPATLLCSPSFSPNLYFSLSYALFLSLLPHFPSLFSLLLIKSYFHCLSLSLSHLSYVMRFFVFCYILWRVISPSPSPCLFLFITHKVFALIKYSVSLPLCLVFSPSALGDAAIFYELSFQPVFYSQSEIKAHEITDHATSPWLVRLQMPIHECTVKSCMFWNFTKLQMPAFIFHSNVMSHYCSSENYKMMTKSFRIWTVKYIGGFWFLSARIIATFLIGKCWIIAVKL